MHGRHCKIPTHFSGFNGSKAYRIFVRVLCHGRARQWHGTWAQSRSVFSIALRRRKGGRFDVQIGSALFLQFKLAEELTRRSAKETKKGLLDPTFYRFRLHRRDLSSQHQLLIQLENQGNQVYYIAPKFADLKSLDAAYTKKRVVMQSALFSPVEIGALPDDKYHSVAFKPGKQMGGPIRAQRNKSRGSE
jgi:hypothetical protein